MHQQIKKKLDEALDILSEKLLLEDHEQWLVMFLETFIKIENGYPYVSAVKEMYDHAPGMDTPEIKGAISDIILLLSGRHHIIRESSTSIDIESLITLHDEVREAVIEQYSTYIAEDTRGNLTLIGDFLN